MGQAARQRDRHSFLPSLEAGCGWPGMINDKILFENKMGIKYKNIPRMGKAKALLVFSCVFLFC
jgi:hypothetical protein